MEGTREGEFVKAWNIAGTGYENEYERFLEKIWGK